MPRIKKGQPAPEVRLPDQDGKTRALSDYRGRWVLLYFYPKDHTSGCTKEACSLRDHFTQFLTKKAVVLGVSIDSVASHKSFAEKYALPFTILSDIDKKAAGAYGVWKGKTAPGGRKYYGTLRASFLIDPKGKIAEIYENVDPETHAEEVLRDLNR